MSEIGKTDFILRKSYEIAYALWRIAENIQERNLADKLSAKAIELIGYAADLKYDQIDANIPGLEFLVRFGEGVGSIGLNNADMLIKEIGNLKSEIHQIQAKNFGKAILNRGEVDISDIFTARPAEQDIAESKPEAEITEAENGNKEIRQTAILERIRQIGNCRLGDIQAILPDVSDRTIRYDLESLVQRNIIERIGTGGRSVYYRIAGSITG